MSHPDGSTASGHHGLEGLVWWLRGMLAAGARYVTQRVPLYRRDRRDEDGTARMPDLERELVGDPHRLQRAGEGIGSLFHRRYWIHMADTELGPEELIDRIVQDPNVAVPRGMARFEDGHGHAAGRLETGDEVVVRLPGPWNGPVRVIQRTPTSLRFATLQGHMEAGEIELRASYDDRGFLRFEIESWARSGDRLFDVLYERFPIGRELQMHMWSQFCLKVAKLSGGVRMSNVSASTRQLDRA